MTFRGNDRRTAKHLKTALERALARDAKIPSLSTRSKLSSIPIIDPADPVLVAAATAILNRCTAVLAL